MAITVNNIQTQTGSSQLTGYVPSSVTDSCLVVIVGQEDTSNDDPAISAVLFNAAPLTEAVLVENVVSETSADVAIYYLVNPGTSSGTITVAGGQVTQMGIVAMTLGDVDQISPLMSTDSVQWTSGDTASTSWTPTFNAWGAITGILWEDASEELSETGTATNYTALATTGCTVDYCTEVGTGTGAEGHVIQGPGAATRGAVATAIFQGATEAAAVARKTAGGRKYPYKVVIDGRIVTIRSYSDERRLMSSMRPKRPKNPQPKQATSKMIEKIPSSTGAFVTVHVPKGRKVRIG